MREPDLLHLFARPIHDASLRCLVAGSLGSMFYAEPRLTLDVDFAIAVPASDLAKLVVHL